MKEIDKRRIIFYGIKEYPSTGGTSRVAENLIRNLIKDYNIIVYCYKHPKALLNIPGASVVQFSEIKLRELGVFLYYFFSCFHILLFQKRGSIIHAHKTDCAVFIPFLRLKYKVIITSHEAPYRRDKWGFTGRLYFRIMEKTFINCGAVLTSISNPLTEYYRAKYNKNVLYIPNGIYVDSEKSKDEAAKLLSDYNIRPGYLLFAARRLMFSKGIHTYLKAIKSISSDIDALYAGEISHASAQLVKLLDSANAENVKYIGFISDLKVLLSIVEQASLFIFPSESEGMSIMLLEVVSTKTPVICSDIPENKEIFNESEVLYFKDKDPVDLAEKIQWALDNPEIMAEKALLAYDRVKYNYSWDAITFQYKELYNKIFTD